MKEYRDERGRKRVAFNYGDLVLADNCGTHFDPALNICKECYLLWYCMKTKKFRGSQLLLEGF